MLNISATRRRNRTAAELNMAPLIDMVFLLLIFFLVNTSFVKETGIDGVLSASVRDGGGAGG